MKLLDLIRHAAAALTVVAVLVPGVPLDEQPNLPPPAPMDRWAEQALLLEIAEQIEAARDAQAPSTAAAPAGDTGTPDPPAPPSSDDPGGLEAGIPDVWLRLADCESGNWIDGGAAFVEGSARWTWAKPGTEVPPWGTRIHHGGLQFHPDTWTWVAPDVLENPPTYAYDATPRQQVAVAIETQRRQGWGAWPVCARKLGLG